MSVRPVVSLVFRTFKRKAVVKAGGNEWGKEEETHDELVLRLGLEGFTIKRGPKIQSHVYFLFAQRSVYSASINEKEMVGGRNRQTSSCSYSSSSRSSKEARWVQPLPRRGAGA